MRVIGVMMVKNESRWISDAIRAADAFVDRWLFLDTGSTDGTQSIIVGTMRALQRPRNSISSRGYMLHEGVPLLETHAYVEQFVNRVGTWVFGVDGDEIYDPLGLARVRTQLLAGHGSRAYQLKGYYLHVDSIADRVVTGYLGPPSHNPTKLYNFENITAWPSDDVHTLFHPKTRIPAAGTVVMQPTQGWRSTALRCVHMRFVERSSTDGKVVGARLSPEDITGHGSRRDRGGRDDRNERISYRKGPLVRVNLDTFTEV